MSRTDGHTDSKTRLHLVPATGQACFRVAVSSRGALNVYPRQETPVGRIVYNSSGPDQIVPMWEHPAWSRWDTPGRTLYAGETKRAAYAEVLQDHRRKLDHAHLLPLATAMGMSLADYIQQFENEASVNGMMSIGQVAASWRHSALMYTVTLPAAGWWVDIEHGDTLNELWDKHCLVLTAAGRLEPLARTHVLSDDRCLTLLLAKYMRDLVLDDGSSPLGVYWGSKLGYGDNYALWLRKTDIGDPDGLDASAPVLDEVSADDGTEISDSDHDLQYVAAQFRIHVH